MKKIMEKAVELIKGIIENTISVEQMKNLLESSLTKCDYFICMSLLKLVYTLSYFFLDKEAFAEIGSYIKSKGLSYDFFDYDSFGKGNLYWIWRYYNGDERIKELAIEKIDMDNEIWCGDNINIIVYMLTEDSRIYKKVFDYLFFKDDSFGYESYPYETFFDDLFIYAAVNKQIGILDNLIKCGKKLKTEYIAALAIEHTDIFYGFLEKYHSSFIPNRFFGQDGKMLLLDKFISCLFMNSSVWKSEYANLKTLVGILYKLFNIIGIEGLRKIEKYIPKIEVITYLDSSHLLLNNELANFVSEKAGEVILLRDALEYGIDCLNWLPLLCNLFKNSTIYIELESVFVVKKEKSLYKALKMISKDKIRIAFKEKRWIRNVKEIVALNSERVILEAIKIGIINKENYEYALETTVKVKAIKALNVLNNEYDTVQKKEVHRIALKKEMDDNNGYYYTCD